MNTVTVPDNKILRNPIQLQELWDKANDIQKDCMDMTVNDISKSLNFRMVSSKQKYLMFTPDKVQTYGKFVSQEKEFDTRTAHLTPYSFSQLCSKLGVPLRYMYKCEKQGFSELIRSNINEWISQDNRSMLIRLYQDEVRGILGKRYSAFDTPDIIQVVSNFGYIQDNFVVKGYVLDPTRLHIRLVSLEPFSNLTEEDLFPGIVIDSSDVGKSSLRINFFVYKQVCTNGLMLPIKQAELFSQRHIGIDLPDFILGVKNGMETYPNLVRDIKFMLGKAITSSSLSVSESSDLLLRNDLFSKDSAKEIVDLQHKNYKDNVWGLINAVTEYAQEFSLERRLQFEEFAGNLFYSGIIFD